MSLCPPCQELYEGWLAYKPAPWRGKCWRCLTGTTTSGLCRHCIDNLATRRREQHELARRQLDGISNTCRTKHQEPA